MKCVVAVNSNKYHGSVMFYEDPDDILADAAAANAARSPDDLAIDIVQSTGELIN